MALLCRRDWLTVMAAFGGEADIDRVRRDVWKSPFLPSQLGDCAGLRLLDLDARELHHLGPLLGFVSNKLPQGR
jgi:hypothetical protein